MKKFLLVPFFLLMTACANEPAFYPVYEAIDSSEEMFNVEWNFIDIPAENRLEIRLTNQLNVPICLSSGQYWPRNGGIFNHSSDGVTLIVGSGRYLGEKWSAELCFGCAEFVPPGETAIASIPYSVFNLPEQLFLEKKQLEFNPKAFRCKKVGGEN